MSCSAVADAVNGETELDSAAEARKQIILADRIVISKSDLATPATIESLTRRVKALNPRAVIDIAVAGALDPNRMIEPAERRARGVCRRSRACRRHNQFCHHAGPTVSWPVFSRAMEALIALRGADLLRVKGILDVEGCRGPVVVQYVQHLAHPPVELEVWPDSNRGSRVVFITRGIAEGHVKALFAAIAALAKSAE